MTAILSLGYGVACYTAVTSDTLGDDVIGCLSISSYEDHNKHVTDRVTQE